MYDNQFSESFAVHVLQNQQVRASYDGDPVRPQVRVEHQSSGNWGVGVPATVLHENLGGIRGQ